MRATPRSAFLFALSLLAACERPAPTPPGSVAGDVDEHGFTAPTPRTAESNAEVARSLLLADAQDFEDARRGLVASEPGLVIRAADGRVVWSPGDFAFVAGDAPAPVWFTVTAPDSVGGSEELGRRRCGCAGRRCRRRYCRCGRGGFRRVDPG